MIIKYPTVKHTLQAVSLTVKVLMISYKFSFKRLPISCPNSEAREWRHNSDKLRQQNGMVEDLTLF